MLYIICVIGGIIIGCMVSLFICFLYSYDHTYGTLKQASDGEETYLFLDLDQPPEKIMDRNWVIFKVDGKKITSHE